MTRQARIEALMKLYEHGELSRAELEEQTQIADEIADDIRRQNNGIG